MLILDAIASVGSVIRILTYVGAHIRGSAGRNFPSKVWSTTRDF